MPNDDETVPKKATPQQAKLSLEERASVKARALRESPGGPTISLAELAKALPPLRSRRGRPTKEHFLAPFVRQQFDKRISYGRIVNAIRLFAREKQATDPDRWTPLVDVKTSTIREWIRPTRKRARKKRTLH